MGEAWTMVYETFSLKETEGGKREFLE